MYPGSGGRQHPPISEPNDNFFWKRRRKNPSRERNPILEQCKAII
jgi:hypothetical protein